MTKAEVNVSRETLTSAILSYSDIQYFPVFFLAIGCAVPAGSFLFISMEKKPLFYKRWDKGCKLARLSEGL